MSLPRQVLPDKFHMVTRRCTQRQFLLRPDKLTNEIFEYCVAVAAQKFDIVIVLPLAMTNHHHTVVYDPTCKIEQFKHYFHMLVARAMNAHRGRWENFWDNAPPCVVELVDAADVIEKLVYVATNPVKAGLVVKADHWPGFSGLRALLSGKPIVVRRPAHFFRDLGPMPETVTLEMVIPPQLGDAVRVRATLRRRIAEVEAECAVERRKARRRVLGAAAVRRQAWWWAPTSRETRRGMRPRVAAKDWLRRLETVQRNKSFQIAYRAAYRAWRDGDRDVVFPAGTYWLARFANVRVAPLEKI